MSDNSGAYNICQNLISKEPAGAGSLKRIVCHQVTVQPDKLFSPLWAFTRTNSLLLR